MRDAPPGDEQEEVERVHEASPAQSHQSPVSGLSLARVLAAFGDRSAREERLGPSALDSVWKRGT